MANVKQLVRVGNSTGLILDQPFLKQLDLAVGSEVSISIEKNSLVIRAHRYATDDEAEASAKRMVVRHRKSLERLSR